MVKGSAVRTAYSSGFHKIEHGFIFKGAIDPVLLRHLWMSMFILDRLMCEFIDRPMAIQTSDLQAILQSSPQAEANHRRARVTHLSALNAVFASTDSMVQIIEKFGKKKTVSTHLGLDVLEKCREHSRALPPVLSSLRSVHEELSPAEGLAILYANLLEAHCKLLTTRPFFLYVFSGLLRSKRPIPTTKLTDLEKLAQACLEVSVSVVTMIHNACKSHWVARRNAFIL